ncbi:MAG: hypothetical protein ACE366_07600 [Bradymonadia bacterium]
MIALTCAACIDPQAPRFPDALTNQNDLDAATRADVDVRVDAALSPDADRTTDADIVSEDASPSVDAADEVADTAIEDAAIEDAAIEDAAIEDAAIEDAAIADAALEDATIEDAAFEEDAEAPDSLYAGGQGTPEDPYLISTFEHLHNIRCHPNASFTLLNDITIPDGQPFVPIGAELAVTEDCRDTPFQGTINGENFVICGLVIDGRQSEVPVGLFSRVNAGIIRNLSLSSVNVVAGAQPAGALIGEVISPNQLETILQSISVSGAVRSDDSAGGLVGRGSDVSIEGATFTGTVDGRGPVGGIAGRLSNAHLTEVQVISERIQITELGDPSGRPAGGIVGELRGSGGLRIFAVQVDLLRGQRFVGGAVGRWSSADPMTDGYAAGTLQTGGATPEAAGGLVGHHLSPSGLSRVFSAMDMTNAGPRSSTGRIIGRYDGDLALDNVYYQEDILGAACVGANYIMPENCTAISNMGGYFNVPGNPPMSLWEHIRWGFEFDMLPTLTNTRPAPDQRCP